MRATPPFTHSIALLVTTSRFRLCRFFFCVFFSSAVCSCRWLISSFSWQRVAPDRMVVYLSLFTFPRLVMLSSVFFSRFIFCTKSLPKGELMRMAVLLYSSYTRGIRFSTLFSRAAPSKLSSLDARSRQLINALGTRGGFVSSFLLYTHYTMAVIIFELYSVCLREL